MQTYPQRIRSGLDARLRRAVKRVRGCFPRQPKPAILMYHRVMEDSFDPWGTAIAPAKFAEQVQWLSHRRTVLPLEEFATMHAAGNLPPSAVAVTFDDGYACSAEVAAPLLHCFEIPATIFLPVALIEKGAPFWWDELEQIVFDHAGTSLDFDCELVLGPKDSDDRRWPPGASPRTPRQKAYHKLQSQLVMKKPEELDRSMRKLREQRRGATDISPRKCPMTPEQVRRTASPLIDFGFHSLTHAWLPNLSPAEQAREIADSANQCCTLTGSRPVAFAYPFGACDETSERLVAEAGYVCACSTENIAVSEASRAFALPRVQVGNWHAADLARMLREL